MTDDPTPEELPWEAASMSLSRLEFGQGYLKNEIVLSRGEQAGLRTDITAGHAQLRGDLEAAHAKLRADLEAGQALFLGTLNGWMEQLRDDQKAALGHATMAFTAAEGNSLSVNNLLQLFYELQRRVLDIEGRLDRQQDDPT